MYRLRIQSHFHAAHKLNGYQGKCENLHGHTWNIEIFIIGNDLNNIGLLVDFKILKANLNKIIKNLDHAYLNDIKEIGNPSSENIAKYIYNKIEIPVKQKLEKVRVWESTEAYAEYFK